MGQQKNPIHAMKRYLAFHGDLYNREGGMYDCIGDFDNLQDAIKACQDKEKENEPRPDWYFLNSFAHVYDQRKKEMVWESD